MNEPGSHLIIGGDSLLGSALSLSLRQHGLEILETTRRQSSLPTKKLFLDLAHADKFAIPEKVRVAYLMAGMTNTWFCSMHPSESYAVNVVSTLVLAKRLLASGIHVVFLSTNHVFDGEVPFVAEDTPSSPRTTYGRQKAEVEAKLLAERGKVSIIRLTKVLAPTTTVVEDWIGKIKAGQEISPFMDFALAPLSTKFVVTVLKRVAEVEAFGTIHVSSANQIGYVDLANHIADKAGRRDLVRPTTSKESGRPLEYVSKFVTLDTAKLNSVLDLKTPDEWQMVKEGLG